MSEEEMLKRKYTRPYEKRIAELEKENKVLAQNLEDTEILNKTYEKRFDDLEKENAKVKELLKEFVHHYKAKTIYIENMQELLEQAEQFLKDCEVEK